VSGEYAKVRILDVPYHGDRVYEHYIPQTLSEAVVPGCLVNVSFGRGNRKCAAIVTDVTKSQDGERELKPIFSVSSDSPVLTEEEIALCRFMCD
jgi:primosomal protein N' (replication factor Y)